jgi:hypothetical protein
MQAAEYDFYIEQGSAFDETIVWTDSADAAVNLTGYSARLSLRTNKGATTPTFEFESTTPSAAQGTITLGGVLGTIRLTADADLTRVMTFDRCFYDLELASDGTDPHTSNYTIRLVEGFFILSKEVSKAE